jgi:hypothetical protein
MRLLCYHFSASNGGSEQIGVKIYSVSFELKYKLRQRVEGETSREISLGRTKHRWTSITGGVRFFTPSVLSTLSPFARARKRVQTYLIASGNTTPAVSEPHGGARS